jgi:hypothetical protein
MKGHASSTKFDQTALETQPLALKRIRLAAALGPDLADQAKKRVGVGHALLYSSRPNVERTTLETNSRRVKIGFPATQNPPDLQAIDLHHVFIGPSRRPNSTLKPSSYAHSIGISCMFWPKANCL